MSKKIQLTKQEKFTFSITLYNEYITDFYAADTKAYWIMSINILSIGFVLAEKINTIFTVQILILVLSALSLFFSIRTLLPTIIQESSKSLNINTLDEFDEHIKELRGVISKKGKNNGIAITFWVAEVVGIVIGYFIHMI